MSTMAERAGLVALAERCERSEGWDSGLDADIARALGWEQDAEGDWHQVGVFFSDGVRRRTVYAVDLPRYTASLDAALTLVGANAFWRVGHDGDGPDPALFKGTISIAKEGGMAITFRNATARTPALALCAAALRALAAEAADA